MVRTGLLLPSSNRTPHHQARVKPVTKLKRKESVKVWSEFLIGLCVIMTIALAIVISFEYGTTWLLWTVGGLIALGVLWFVCRLIGAGILWLGSDAAKDLFKRELRLLRFVRDRQENT